MNLKSILTFLVILVLGSVSGFIVGQKSTETVDKFSVSLHQLQGDIRVLQDQFTGLEQELAKKTGIIIKDSPINIETTLAKADELTKQGQLSQAALYFSNALSQSPGNWNIIEHYQQTILEHCQQLNQQDDYETSLNILSDLDVFIRTQATTVTTQHIDKLAKTLADIAAFRETVIADKIAQDHEENNKFIKKLLINTDRLLKQTPTHEIAGITPHLDELKDNLLTLQSVDTTTLPKNELTEMNSRVDLLGKTITDFEQQLVAIQQLSNVSNLVKQTKTLINQANHEPPDSYLILYYLNLADSLINQLVLSTLETKGMKTQIAQLSKELDLVKKNLAKAQSQLIWDEIEKIKTKQLKMAIDTKAQNAITKLVQLRQVFAEKASNLSSLEFIDQAKALREEIENTLAEWQNKQIRWYNMWAIDKIKGLYETQKEQLGVGTDEKMVYTAMIDSLGAIDTRYLSTPAMTAYNEVFQKFYTELNDQQKIILSSQMTLMTKKPLSDF